MKTDYRNNWPVCHRCEKTEAQRRGEADEVRAEHWFWFTALFLLIVVAPAVVEWIV